MISRDVELYYRGPPPIAVQGSKEEIRRYVWDLMVKRGVATFPPPHGRIPNFVGAEETARTVRGLDVYRRARVVKVSPDSPQRPIREFVLRDGKVLIMPTPRLRGGFILLDGRDVRGLAQAASTIRGAMRLGREVYPDELPEVDLIVTGSVAVSLNGRRLGKGGGYSELEYAILREYGKVGEDTPIVSNVHDLQVFNMLPRDPYDITLDVIVTPTRVIRVENREERPKGIIWGALKPEKIREIPLLERLRRERFRP